MNRDFWNEVYQTDAEEHSCIEAISSERKIQARAYHALSDELSARKRRSRDILLAALVYRRLLTQVVVLF